MALAALAVVTAEPLTRDQLMRPDDLPFHRFRAVEMGHLLALGPWLPRWAPHMADGSEHRAQGSGRRAQAE